jgi:GNAT superfamily N-acetyltransferase
VAAYRAIFREVGQDLLWFSRLIMTDEALRRNLARPEVEAVVVLCMGKAIGMFELDFSEPETCELALFGLVPTAIGRGCGRLLMEQAKMRAFQKPIRRFWVHTCHYDHPRALAFYQAAGFKIYELKVEVHDDPRLLGYLPLDAAPQVPLIKP